MLQPILPCIIPPNSEKELISLRKQRRSSPSLGSGNHEVRKVESWGSVALHLMVMSVVCLTAL